MPIRFSKYLTDKKLNKVKVHVAFSSPFTLQETLNLMDIIHFISIFTTYNLVTSFV